MASGIKQQVKTSDPTGFSLITQNMTEKKKKNVLSLSSGRDAALRKSTFFSFLQSTSRGCVGRTASYGYQVWQRTQLVSKLFITDSHRAIS